MKQTKPKPVEASSKAGLLNITYFTDPLCCWSWGLEPIWQQIKNNYDGRINVRYCMGGLLPGWNQFYDAENNVSRPIQMGPVWMHASQVTGLPIDSNIWFRDPPASSYPACIAVKCAGLQSWRAEGEYLGLLRKAVMEQGRNIAKYDVLYDVAKHLAISKPHLLDYTRFSRDMQNENGLEAFRKDMQEIQLSGISRFPSMVFQYPRKKPLLVSGYKPFEVYEKTLMTLLEEN